MKGRSNMLPLLLLLLTPYCLADQVCFNFTNFEITITINNTQIIDKPPNVVECPLGDDHFLDCTFAKEMNGSWFNESYGCLKANVSQSFDYLPIYCMEHNINCILYPCVSNAVSDVMHSLNLQVEGMVKLFYIRDSCLKLFSHFSPHHTLKASYINVEKQMIHNIMDTSASNFTSYNLKNLGINVMSIKGNVLDTEEDRIAVKAAELPPESEFHVPEIWLPADALRDINEEDRVVGTVSYTRSDQFELEPVNISSVVIRIELLHGKRLQHLHTSVQMIFKNVTHTDMETDKMFACHYFDEQDWHWKTDGCQTHSSDNNSIICNCDHTTAFAVLLIRVPIDAIHWEILSVISYIGCGLSAFFTALSIIIFVFSQSNKMDHSISIHVSLSAALFLLNTTFLLTEWGATVKPDWVCVFVAAAMHYSLLCCFTWMAIEAVHLYLLLIKVFNTQYKRYLLKLSLAGWGIPGVIVSVSLGVKDKHFYGITKTNMADSNQTSAICWITDDSFFYSLNLVYFTLIFIFNSGILMAVASSICKMKQVFRNVKVGAETNGNTWRDPARFSESCKSGFTVLGLTCLMGTTWGLAFLGSGYVNYPILYLFCILNSTQGFFIFIWIYLSTKKQRKREMEDKRTSTPVKTSTTKSD